jgi:endonuclease/exonuclease/phosphatase family metal-dependent hydrolase
MENDKHIILAGDFNCPDIDWTNMTTKIHANDKEIQKSLIEIEKPFPSRGIPYI